MRILIVNCEDAIGMAYPDGHPDAWFQRAAGGDPSRFAVWNACGCADPPAGRFHGVIVSGSFYSVYDDQPWIGRVARMILATVESGVALLGVCFGHQLIAQTLGGRVDRNPLGPEHGTLPVFFTDAGRTDPLFDGIHDGFPSFHFHGDTVLELPPAAETLAYTPKTAVQAFRLGDRIRAIQFHPELTTGNLAHILDHDRELLEKQGVPVEAVRCGLCDTPLARRILVNFERHFVHDRVLETT